MQALWAAVDEDDKTSDSVQKGNDRLVISDHTPLSRLIYAG